MSGASAFVGIPVRYFEVSRSRLHLFACDARLIESHLEHSDTYASSPSIEQHHWLTIFHTRKAGKQYLLTIPTSTNFTPSFHLNHSYFSAVPTLRGINTPWGNDLGNSWGNEWLTRTAGQRDINVISPGLSLSSPACPALPTSCPSAENALPIWP